MEIEFNNVSFIINKGTPLEKTILNNVTLESVSNDGDKPVITANNQNYTFDAVLYATGRKANTSNICL